MAITFVQVGMSNNISAAYPGSVTAGNLLVCGFEDSSGTQTATSCSDSRGNVWHNVVVGVGTVCLWWAIANGTGACTVTITETLSNPGIVVAEYSGPQATGIFSKSATSSTAVNGTAVNCGPTAIQLGAITFVITYGQGTSYTSTSGGTTRVVAFRINLIDNLTTTSAYTETGSFSTGLGFGGVAQTFGLGSTGNTRRTLTGAGQ